MKKLVEYLLKIVSMTVSLDNPYALRAYLRTHPRIRSHLDPTVRLPIQGYNVKSVMRVNTDTLSYVVICHEGTIRYECVAWFYSRHVHELFEYVFMYSHVTDMLHRQMNYRDVPFVNECREKIRIQLQTAFCTISSRWNHMDHASLDHPWVAQRLCEFSQRCTPSVANIVQAYVANARRNMMLVRYRHLNMIRTHFKRWKEWYYHPTNEYGYVKHLNAKYTVL